MKTFKIVMPYGWTKQGYESSEIIDRVEKVYTLEVKNGKLKIDKDLILILDSFEQVSETRYNAGFLKPDGSKCYYKNFFIEQRDLEKWIKAEGITDVRRSNQRTEIENETEQD